MMTITGGTTVKTLKFYYDVEGVPFYFDYNGTQYFYITNLQGDVVGIANENGFLGYYEYDAWGRILSINSASSNEYGALTSNPLRYRGYICDNETGFYYLQSRYYDPAIRRFINADSYASTGQDFIGYNMFAYCGNNPIMGIDPFGEWTFSIGFNFSFSIFGSSISFGIGLSCDSDGMVALHWSHSKPSKETRNTVVGASSCAGVNMQWTKLDSIEDLEGSLTNVGVNTSIIGYETVLDENNEKVGDAISLGPTFGADFHVIEYKTDIIGKPFRSLTELIKDWLDW